MSAWSRRRPAGLPWSVCAIGVLVVVAAVTGLLTIGPAGAARGQAPGTTAPVETTIPPADGSGPHLTGRTEPTALQRVVDSFIWVWVLVVLLLGPLLWWWTGRRRRTDDTAGAARERH